MADEGTDNITPPGEGAEGKEPSPPPPAVAEPPPPQSSSQNPSPPAPTTQVQSSSSSGSTGARTTTSAAAAAPEGPQDRKAKDFIEQAEKKVKSSQSFFGGLFRYVSSLQQLCACCVWWVLNRAWRVYLNMHAPGPGH